MDEENMRRAQASEEAQNQWFSRLAELQAREAARQDAAQQLNLQTAQKSQAEAMQSQREAAARAEQRRQFDVTSGERAQEFQWNKDYQERQLQRQQDTTADYAEHLQPLLHEAGTRFEDAQNEYEQAQDKFIKRTNQAESGAGFPVGKVQLSKATGQYEVRTNPTSRLPYELTAVESEAVRQANKELSDIAADMAAAQHKVSVATVDWQAKQKQAAEIGGVPIKQGKTWLLRIPSLGRTFGKMVEEAKGETQDDESGPVWQPAPNTLGAAMQTWGPPPAELTGGMAPSTATQPGPFSQPTTKVWTRGPDGKLRLAQ